jgi:hypothetical protein
MAASPDIEDDPPRHIFRLVRITSALSTSERMCIIWRTPTSADWYDDVDDVDDTSDRSRPKLRWQHRKGNVVAHPGAATCYADGHQGEKRGSRTLINKIIQVLC